MLLHEAQIAESFSVVFVDGHTCRQSQHVINATAMIVVIVVLREGIALLLQQLSYSDLTL